MNNRPRVVGRRVERAAWVGVYLNPDASPIAGELLPKVRYPLTVKVEPVTHRVMARVYHLSQAVGVTPWADPQCLALSATFAALTHDGEGLLE